ncbi:hypothetical protein NEN40_12120, partial [Staphylococcus epidermidis]|uniref:hypothetical protein n=1 Tax=Staphylococcus epidermidis TaxID=1282 RepID=UPI002DB79CAE
RKVTAQRAENNQKNNKKDNFYIISIEIVFFYLSWDFMSHTLLYCIKKTMRYAYGSEKVLPLSKKTSHHARIYIGQPTKIFNTRRCFFMSSDTNSLAHTKWNC